MSIDDKILCHVALRLAFVVLLSLAAHVPAHWQDMTTNSRDAASAAQTGSGPNDMRSRVEPRVAGRAPLPSPE